MIIREIGFAEPKTMKVFNKTKTRGSSNLSNRNAVVSDQAVDKNPSKPSLLISFFEPSKEGVGNRSTDLFNKNKSKALLASQEVVVTPDSVCGT